MIKNLFAMTVLGAAMSGMALAQAPAAAPAAAPAVAPTKVAVISESRPRWLPTQGSARKPQAELGKLRIRAPRKKELEGKQAEIKDLQDRLQRGGNTLSDSAKEDLTRNIDSKTKSYNRQLEDAQAELEQEQQKLVNGLGQKMMSVIDKYAHENGFAIVLDVSNQNTPVLYASSTIDITKECDRSVR